MIKLQTITAVALVHFSKIIFFVKIYVNNFEYFYSFLIYLTKVFINSKLSAVQTADWQVYKL